MYEMQLMKLMLMTLFLVSCNNEKPTMIILGGIEMETIPGITAEDIYKYYSGDSFRTETDIGPELSVWSSIKPMGTYDLIITSTGKNNSQIIAIDAYFKKYIKQEMNASIGHFVGNAATIPYTNSKPEVAKRWAIAHTNSGGDTTIGYVSFKLTNFGDSVHVLKMSVGEWR
jgi:hypothetical protein